MPPPPCIACTPCVMTARVKGAALLTSRDSRTARGHVRRRGRRAVAEQPALLGPPLVAALPGRQAGHRGRARTASPGRVQLGDSCSVRGLARDRHRPRVPAPRPGTRLPGPGPGWLRRATQPLVARAMVADRRRGCSRPLRERPGRPRRLPERRDDRVRRATDAGSRPARRGRRPPRRVHVACVGPGECRATPLRSVPRRGPVAARWRDGGRRVQGEALRAARRPPPAYAGRDQGRPQCRLSARSRPRPGRPRPEGRDRVRAARSASTAWTAAAVPVARGRADGPAVVGWVTHAPQALDPTAGVSWLPDRSSSPSTGGGVAVRDSLPRHSGGTAQVAAPCRRRNEEAAAPTPPRELVPARPRRARAPRRAPRATAARSPFWTDWGNPGGVLSSGPRWPGPRRGVSEPEASRAAGASAHTEPERPGETAAQRDDRNVIGLLQRIPRVVVSGWVLSASCCR